MQASSRQAPHKAWPEAFSESAMPRQLPSQVAPGFMQTSAAEAQIASDAGSPAGTTVCVGDFSNLLIGLRTSFRLEATRIGAGAFENLQVAVRAFLRADIQLAHPETFVVRTDVDV